MRLAAELPLFLSAQGQRYPHAKNSSRKSQRRSTYQEQHWRLPLFFSSQRVVSWAVSGAALESATEVQVAAAGVVAAAEVATAAGPLLSPGGNGCVDEPQGCCRRDNFACPVAVSTTRLARCQEAGFMGSFLLWQATFMAIYLRLGDDWHVARSPD